MGSASVSRDGRLIGWPSSPWQHGARTPLLTVFVRHLRGSGLLRRKLLAGAEEAADPLQGGEFAPFNIDLQQVWNAEAIQKPVQGYCNDRVRATAAAEEFEARPSLER